MEHTSLRQVVRIGSVVLGLAALGEAGHQVFERMHWEAGHHAFHTLYAAGAIVAFAIYAIRDVRANGFPRLRWSLRPDEDAAPASR